MTTIMPLEGKPGTVEIRHLKRPYREISKQKYLTLLDDYLTDHFFSL